MPPAALLDVDGTLVDTSYQHVLAWGHAFGQFGVEVPLWKIHRHIGMGGDQIVPALAGEEVEERCGGEIRAAEKAVYGVLIDHVRPLPGARELIEELRRRGHTVILASSAKAPEAEHYVELLGVRDLVDGWTTSADVEATKPAPDLVRAAREKAGGGEAVLVGDATWDVRAAAEAGLPAIAVLTGGFGEAELREAGAVAVYDSVAELAADLDATPLRGPDR